MKAGIAIACLALFSAAGVRGQVGVSGRVIDETGAGVAGARVELRDASGASLATSSDEAGNFSLSPGNPGEYEIRAQRQGFYIYQGKGQELRDGTNQLTVVLNHVQEISSKVDVRASAPPIDPQQLSDRKELDNTQIINVPYPASRDYRNALPMMDGVVQDTSARNHFNGGDTNQTSYTLDGFNIADPVTGNLDTRLNINSIQSMDLESSRYAAENGRGSSGALDLKTKTGDDKFRFGTTNFFPGFSTEGGLHVSKWNPQIEFSGPIAKGRAWFHEGLDNFYSIDVIHGLPNGQNQTNGLTSSSISRFQVNLTPANILTASLLVNRADVDRSGLSFLTPAEATTNLYQMLYMSSLRDQAYLSGGALLDVGFADTRGLLQSTPQGNSLYEITAYGNRGNYFTGFDRHFYRQQWVANLFLPMLRLHGAHQLKFGVDFEREAFHQEVMRHDYEVLRADDSVARYVQFAGNPFLRRRNFDGAQYVQDRWTPREGVAFEAGLRFEWNEIVRQFQVAPRFSAVWAPGRLRDTKFSAGWGTYYDAMNLQLLARPQDQASLSTFFPTAGPPAGPLISSFAMNDHTLHNPEHRNASLSVERKLPMAVYLKASYLHRTGSQGFTFLPLSPQAAVTESGTVVYTLRNALQDRYDAFEISARHTFAGRYEWFAGYTRSNARSNAAVDFSLENPVFAAQAPGPYAWDAPNRFHTWGWAPLPNTILPASLRFLTRDTIAAYMLEYHTGFPFSIVDQSAFLVGTPNGERLPAYFSLNLDFERQFRVLRYVWAWRFGFTNLTNSANPNYVNNVLGSPQFLTYARGQGRAFNVRLRLLGSR